MRVIKNINSVNVCTLGNKGVGSLCAALDSLMKKDRKNTANYLVVTNNFVLSLSSRIRARSVPCNPCKQRTFRSFLCSLFYVPT